MTTLISYGNELGFTILPYTLEKPVHLELISHPHDDVLGYITHNKETNERKFTYTESGGLTEVNDHWSLTIIKEFPYCEESGSWIVYRCSPEKTRLAFGKFSLNMPKLYIFITGISGL